MPQSGCSREDVFRKFVSAEEMAAARFRTGEKTSRLPSRHHAPRYMKYSFLSVSFPRGRSFAWYGKIFSVRIVVWKLLSERRYERKVDGGHWPAQNLREKGPSGIFFIKKMVITGRKSRKRRAWFKKFSSAYAPFCVKKTDVQKKIRFWPSDGAAFYGENI